MMETDRRTVLASGAALTALIAGGGTNGARAAPAAPPPGLLEVLHVHVGPEGKSQLKRVRIEGRPAPLPDVTIQAGSIGVGDGHWGNVPSKRFSINMVGDIEVELGDGSKHHIGQGDLVYLEDLTGTGHFSRFLSPVANMFLLVPDDFDFAEWARSGSPDDADQGDVQG